MSPETQRDLLHATLIILAAALATAVCIGGLTLLGVIK